MVSSLKLTFKDVAIRQFYYLCVFLILSFENRRKKIKCVRHTSFIYFYLSRNIGIIYSSIYNTYIRSKNDNMRIHKQKLEEITH